MTVMSASAAAAAAMAVERCGNCSFENILKRGQKIGLLNNCDHVFCLDCVRDWRASSDEVAIAYIVLAYIVLAYVVMAYIGMAYILMAYMVMAYIIIAYIVIASAPTAATGVPAPMKCQ